MTRYRIATTIKGASIEVADVEGRQSELLEALAECQSGNCTCRTTEYEKVADMQVDATDSRIELWLDAKPGTAFDTTEIGACLDHTISKTVLREA